MNETTDKLQKEWIAIAPRKNTIFDCVGEVTFPYWYKVEAPTPTYGNEHRSRAFWNQKMNQNWGLCGRTWMNDCPKIYMRYY